MTPSQHVKVQYLYLYGIDQNDIIKCTHHQCISLDFVLSPTY